MYSDLKLQRMFIQSMIISKRPTTNLAQFEKAFELASLNDEEKNIIEYIRFVGIFNQPLIVKSLQISNKPPVLSKLCIACREIGKNMPEHFENIRAWSEITSKEKVRWDGSLICSPVYNIDGQILSPEEGTAQFHNFSVHKELFNGL